MLVVTLNSYSPGSNAICISTSDGDIVIEIADNNKHKKAKLAITAPKKCSILMPRHAGVAHRIQEAKEPTNGQLVTNNS